MFLVTSSLSIPSGYPLPNIPFSCSRVLLSGEPTLASLIALTRSPVGTLP